MKKSLVALAVLSAFAGIASAQTSVTVYGIVDAGITREDSGLRTFNRLDSGNQSTSRLGFKGTEDLGGGLSAQFLLEQGFSLDNGAVQDSARTAFNRQAYIGLTGNFGQVRLGRQKTVMYDALAAIDPFGIASKGGMDRVFMRNVGRNTDLSTAGAGRSDNTIAYFTPNLSGFTGQATYAFGEQANNNRAGRQYGLSLNYAAGPLVATIDYLNAERIPAAATLLAPAVTAGNGRGTLIGATYDFGIAKAHAAYGIEKSSSVIPTVAPESTDNRDYMVGASVPFGASAVQVDYIKKIDRSGLNAGAKQYALGYTYALSKRTNFYSSYSAIHQGSINYAGATGDANQIDRIINLGVRHTF